VADPHQAKIPWGATGVGFVALLTIILVALMDEIEKAGVYTGELKTRAELVEVQRDPGDRLSRLTEDDDSGYVPDSYYAHTMERDDYAPVGLDPGNRSP
jgi:hypothetical protein